MAALIVAGVALVGLGIAALRGKKKACNALCFDSHRKAGGNYEWLRAEYGTVLKIEFEEPANSGRWVEYDDRWWHVHCDVIPHTVRDLVDAHVRAFVDPSTRFARLRFTFDQNGRQYTAEPTRRFYELERDYFARRKPCR
ncbi:MAG: hypothetical protein KGL39_01185 [Patescibacteria group bacterium]|nr:hypothetical protein [Patescibacteria group bacterium]